MLYEVITAHLSVGRIDHDPEADDPAVDNGSADDESGRRISQSGRPEEKSAESRATRRPDGAQRIRRAQPAHQPERSREYPGFPGCGISLRSGRTAGAACESADMDLRRGARRTLRCLHDSAT